MSPSATGSPCLRCPHCASSMLAGSQVSCYCWDEMMNLCCGSNVWVIVCECPKRHNFTFGTATNSLHPYTPRDVDLVLGMPNPTGSLKLVLHHCGQSGKWSKTTTIVLVYLVVNIAGRLSVAIFGLTQLPVGVGTEPTTPLTDLSDLVHHKAPDHRPERYILHRIPLARRWPGSEKC
jgi:hypothetical protein